MSLPGFITFILFRQILSQIFSICILLIHEIYDFKSQSQCCHCHILELLVSHVSSFLTRIILGVNSVLISNIIINDKIVYFYILKQHHFIVFSTPLFSQ